MLRLQLLDLLRQFVLLIISALVLCYSCHELPEIEGREQ